jgi:hypothetical protein
MNEAYIVNDYIGVQKGTKDQPFSPKSAIEYDTLIASLLRDENGVIRRQFDLHYGSGTFLSWGCYEFGNLATAERPRFGPEWQAFGSETVLALDPNLPDSYMGEWPLHVLCSTAIWQDYLWRGREQEWIDLPPEEAWKLLPRRQLITGITFDLSYSKFIDRWKAAGLKLCLSGGILGGHGPAYEKVKVRNFGAHHVVDADGKIVGPGAEAFPLPLAGAVDGFDRNKIARLIPKEMAQMKPSEIAQLDPPFPYIFDADLTDDQCAHHTECEFEDYCTDSNDQVSMCVISASIGQPDVHPLSAGDETSPFVHTWRRWSYQRHNPLGTFPNTNANQNQLQGFTMYQSLASENAFNGGSNMQAGYYSDFYKSGPVHVHDNEWLRVIRGVCWLLSPSGPDAEHFTSDGHKATRNKITLLTCDAAWHGAFLLWQFGRGPGRRLSDITIGGVGQENTVMMCDPRAPALIGNTAVRGRSVDKLIIDRNNFEERLSPIDLVDCPDAVIVAELDKRGGCSRFNPFKR